MRRLRVQDGAVRRSAGLLCHFERRLTVKLRGGSFVLNKRWQYEAAKASARSSIARQAQRKLAEKERRLEANRALKRVRPRLDVLAAWTNARLKDDQMERQKQRGASAIATELEKATATTVHAFSSLQERCVCAHSL